MTLLSAVPALFFRLHGIHMLLFMNLYNNEKKAKLIKLLLYFLFRYGLIYTSKRASFDWNHRKRLGLVFA